MSTALIIPILAVECLGCTLAVHRETWLVKQNCSHFTAEKFPLYWPLPFHPGGFRSYLIEARPLVKFSVPLAWCCDKCHDSQKT